MNVILILCDTLTRDKLGPYQRPDGPYSHIRTPSIDRFATHAVRFDNHWMNSAPCMPARRDLFSGRIEFPWRSWGPRESFDPDWSLALRKTNVRTALFSDHANLFDVGAGNYHHFFDTYAFVRGHFNDHLELVGGVEPGRVSLPRDLYLTAQRRIDHPDSSYVARNLANVEDWIDERTHSGNEDSFFLFVDEFDPHWPLDPPEPYRSMYVTDRRLLDLDPNDDRVSPFYSGGDVAEYSREHLAWLNAEYAGKVTMVDHYLGRLFECIGRNGLWDDTMVVLTTDHGEYIGEYGQVSKGHGPSYPLFARLPLLIHYPHSANAGESTDELSCAVDLHATVLDALQVPVDPASHGRSLLRLLGGGSCDPSRGQPRTDVLYGWWGKGFYWTDGRRLVCKASSQPGPLYQYGTNLGEKYVGLQSEYFDRYEGAQTGTYLPHTNRPVYRVPSDGMAYSSVGADCDMLFDLEADPECSENLWDADPALRKVTLGRLTAVMRSLEVPSEHYARLGLEE